MLAGHCRNPFIPGCELCRFRCAGGFTDFPVREVFAQPLLTLGKGLRMGSYYLDILERAGFRKQEKIDFLEKLSRYCEIRAGKQVEHDTYRTFDGVFDRHDPERRPPVLDLLKYIPAAPTGQRV